MKRKMAALLCAVLLIGTLNGTARAGTRSRRELAQHIVLAGTFGMEQGTERLKELEDLEGRAVQALTEQGVLERGADPAALLNRRELVKMLALYAGEEPEDAESCLSWAQAEKLIPRGREESWETDPVTRRELAVLLYRLNKLVMGKHFPKEKDVPSAEELGPEVSAVLSAGLMKPDGDGGFHAEREVRLGEAALALDRYDRRSRTYRRGCPLDSLRYITHGGGTVEGSYTVTNSLEALQETDNWGNRVVELDFNWTTDDQLVCLHNWGYGLPEKSDLETFLNGKIYGALTPIGLEQVADWLRTHPDTRIVMDFKERTVEGLQLISKKYPELLEQFIPYVYHTWEYESIRGMGYENMILFLSKMSREEKDFEAMVEFAREKDLVGIAIYPYTEAEIIAPAMEAGVPVLAYTVNDEQWMYTLVQQGVDGFVTDVQNAMIVW